MARPISFVAGLAALVFLAAAATGCSSTSAEDGSATTPNVQKAVATAAAGRDAALEGSEPVLCESAGGRCLVGDAPCTVVGPEECTPGGGAFCCLANDCVGPTAKPQLILASNYDQSCSVDSDCVAVSEGDACQLCLWICRNAAINVADTTRFYSDFNGVAALTNYTGVDCGCDVQYSACCRDGRCHADSQCSGVDASADTGADASPE